MDRYRFRLGPDYQLIPFGRLDAQTEEVFSDLRARSDSYGILQPRKPGGTIKVVGKDAALLLLTLAEAGPLPSFVLEADSAGWQMQIAAWVADSVLEIFDGKKYVSGPAAGRWIMPRTRSAAAPGGLGALSREALRYGAELGLNELDELTERLYGFHRLPLSPTWRHSLADRTAILELLGLSDPYRILPDWHHAEPESTHWIAWQRSAEAGSSPQSSRPTWKLYLSPTMPGIELAFSALLQTLPSTRARAFKVGGDAEGLLRPDKMVVYFDELEDLNDCAERLAAQLLGVPAQGVPFTAEIAGDGLISWGMDPPTQDKILPWQSVESWRSWVVRRLAAALIVAQGRPSDDMPAWRFALERLRLEGVDIDRWVPNPTLWRQTA